MASGRLFSTLFAGAFLAVSLTGCPCENGATCDDTEQNADPKATGSGTGSGASSDVAQELVGHWRSTTIVFDSTQDEHLVLHPDGTWENWVVTASERSETTTGFWRVENTNLIMRLSDSDEEVARPVTLFEGQLVLPNIPDHRRFFERI